MYPPKYPHMGGELDALVRTFQGYVAVEFKGVMKSPKITLCDSLHDLEPHLSQMVLYSFLLGWVDVLFVWAENSDAWEQGDHYIKTGEMPEKRLKKLKHTYFEFSKEKPFKKELEKLSMNFYLDYFMKNVAAPYFFKK